MTDDLRGQLKKLDPVSRGVQMEPVTTESSRARLESIMSTPTVERPQAPQRRTRWYSAVAAVAVVAVAVVGVIAVTGNDTESGPPLALTANANDVTSMCIEFSPEYLTPMPVAFEGTVTSVEGDTVTLTVDRWFKGGDAGEVVITAPQGLEALIGGIEFTEGGQYLITATDGIVNYCGFSGPSTPEMRAAFEEAFPG